MVHSAAFSPKKVADPNLNFCFNVNECTHLKENCTMFNKEVREKGWSSHAFLLNLKGRIHYGQEYPPIIKFAAFLYVTLLNMLTFIQINYMRATLYNIYTFNVKQ